LRNVGALKTAEWRFDLPDRGEARAFRFDRDDLRAALQRLTSAEAAVALRRRHMPIAWQPGHVLHVAADVAAARHARAKGLDVVSGVEPTELLGALEQIFGRAIADHAAYHLARTRSQFSAASRLTPPQAVAMATLLAGLVMAAIAAPRAAGLAAAMLCALFFLAVIGLRFLSLLPPVPAPDGDPPAPLRPMDLPVYTVLVPLHRETSVLAQLLEALDDLRYPRDKLDVKLILEESDIPMRRAVARLALSPPYEVLTVPCLGPQTKPKALNYALAFARGDLVTIFDAEDAPDADQLLAAAARFAHLPPETVCLQAKLAFYNSDDNWLTRQFALEYAVLFELLLPMLASLGLPLPLGGTSNHFRRRSLERVGGWDAHNVTEDADLGIRLHRLGYRAAMLEAVTEEEANSALGNWLAQRARWLKGWLQTWLVHMRDPALLWHELGASGFLLVQALMLGTLVSALVHPLFLGWTVWRLSTGTFFPPVAEPAALVMTSLSLAVLVAGYGIGMAAGVVALRRRKLGRLWPAVLTMPAYWLLQSLAAWMALWQFVRAPFHWNKTRHGLALRRR
jgi:cellulose synthase/poly-beta-1,6-N-acetylglucosamine synthase-like glycosyltransferase